jgi:hypothetical protein
MIFTDQPLSLQDTCLVVKARNKNIQLFQVIIADNMPNVLDTILHKILSYLNRMRNVT